MILFRFKMFWKSNETAILDALTDEWERSKEIGERVGLRWTRAARVLRSLQMKGLVDWKEVQPSGYHSSTQVEARYRRKGAVSEQDQARNIHRVLMGRNNDTPR